MERIREIAPALLVIVRMLVRGTCPNGTIGYLINFPEDSRIDCESDALNSRQACGYHRVGRETALA